MITLARPTTSITSRDQFLALLPQIRAAALFAFRNTPPEAREDLVAEVIAHAFCAFARLVQQGRQELAFATPLAQYAIRRVRAGRRVGTRLSVNDLTSATQATHGTMIEHLDRSSTKNQEWRMALVEDKKAGPAETAAARIDFAAWLRRLSRRHRQIAKTLAGGESTKTAAELFGVSPCRISQLRRELMQSWERLHGEPALV